MVRRAPRTKHAQILLDGVWWEIGPVGRSPARSGAAVLLANVDGRAVVVEWLGRSESDIARRSRVRAAVWRTRLPHATFAVGVASVSALAVRRRHRVGGHGGEAS